MDTEILSRIAGFIPRSQSCNDEDSLPHDQIGRVFVGGEVSTPTQSSLPAPSIVHLICFSKDRAFQLDQLLQSTSRHLLSDEIYLRISILYVATGEALELSSHMVGSVSSEQHVDRQRGTGCHDEGKLPNWNNVRGTRKWEMSDSYDFVRSVHPGVNFLREQKGGFYRQLRELIGDGRGEGGRNSFVLFAVDDMLFYDDFPLYKAVRILNTDLSVHCVHLRLNPHITWSHPAGSPCRVPLFTPTTYTPTATAKVGKVVVGSGTGGDTGLQADFDILTFSREEGSGEWDYPCDLTGGLYRLMDIELILDNIAASFGEAAVANPNLLEHNGHRLLRLPQQQVAPQPAPSASTIARGVLPPRAACAGRAVLCSIAVNRVQATYVTPVYSTHGGDLSDLDRLLQERCNGSCPQGLDESFYRLRRSNSVHVGELVFTGAEEVEGGQDNVVEGTIEAGCEDSGDGLNQLRQGELPFCSDPLQWTPTVTVLLPVLNGGAHLLASITSILNSQGVPKLELLIIDDGSVDGAVEMALEATDNIRCRSYDQMEDNYRVRVIRHDVPQGLAASLNEGMREAQGVLVARMDADDVCFPDRLQRQVDFMLANPRVAVAGSSVAVFSSEASDVMREVTAASVPATGFSFIARHPTDPWFLGWSLLFSCCLAHPSVIMRKSVVLAAGGYNHAAEPAEDYDLWLRLEGEMPGSVVSLGEVLLGLRKHQANLSIARRGEQKDAALAAVTRAAGRLLDHSVTQSQVAVLCNPETAESEQDLAMATVLLAELKDAVLARGIGMKGAMHEVLDGDVGARVKEGGKADKTEEILKERAREFIERDAEARHAAIVVQAMSQFGSGAAPVLAEWSRIYPGRPLLERLSLLG
ncbi:unnamed protein product [Choristocarpus tenellus]